VSLGATTDKTSIDFQNIKASVHIDKEVGLEEDQQPKLLNLN